MDRSMAGATGKRRGVGSCGSGTRCCGDDSERERRMGVEDVGGARAVTVEEDELVDVIVVAVQGCASWTFIIGNKGRGFYKMAH